MQFLSAQGEEDVQSTVLYDNKRQQILAECLVFLLKNE